jgi:hypothetical protein
MVKNIRECGLEGELYQMERETERRLRTARSLVESAIIDQRDQQ